MPRASGTFTPTVGSWYPTTTGASATKADWDTLLADIAAALTQSISADGQTPITANLPLGGFKLTGMGAGTARTDSVNFGQAQDGAYAYLTGVAGTDTITANLSTPSLTAYATGMVVRFIAAGANTGAVTLNINTLGAKAVTKNGTTPLVAGDILSGATYQATYDGTRFQISVYAASGANTDITSLASATTVTTQAAGDNSTKIASTAYADRVSAKIQPITASVAANALTVTINPTVLDFRSSTLTSGTVNSRSVSAAISVVVSSGSTLGTTSGAPNRIAVLAIDNAGTVEVAVVNLAGGTDLSETGVISTTAEGGAGAADSASVIYSTTARASVAYRVVGVIESTQATAGTWATAPSLIQGIGGRVTQTMQLLSGVMQASTSGTSVNFTGIPSWVKRITMMFDQVSTNGTNGMSVQIGDSGGLEASGYVGSCIGGTSGNTLSGSNITTGFPLTATGFAAATTYSGSVTLTLMDAATFRWVAHGTIYANTGSIVGYSIGGVKPLSASLDRISLVSSDTFDAGNVNVLYE